MKNKKICHISSVHLRNDVRIFVKECCSLAEAGFDVTYLCADNLPNEVKNNIKIVSAKMQTANRLKRILFAAKKMYPYAKQINADIYHIHDPELLPLALKLKRKGKKVIFDSHEIYSILIKQKYYLPKFLRSLISQIYKLYEIYVVKKIDAVIIPCTIGGKNFFENKAKKTEVINNVPLLSEFNNCFGNEKDNLEFKLCYIGALSEERGITYIIKAAYNTKTKLIIGGTFISKEYENEVTNMKEFSCVDYRGQVNRKGVFEILRESSVGIATLMNVGQYYLADNFPTKVYEYMSMGLPVILSNTPYVQKIINEKNLVFVSNLII